MIGVPELVLEWAPALTADRPKKDPSAVQPGSETTASDTTRRAPDADLAELCRSGDKLGYERLYQLHGARMKSIAWNMLRNHQDAENARQDTFVKVHRSIHTYKGVYAQTPDFSGTSAKPSLARVYVKQLFPDRRESRPKATIKTGQKCTGNRAGL